MRAAATTGRQAIPSHAVVRWSALITLGSTVLALAFTLGCRPLPRDPFATERQENRDTDELSLDQEQQISNFNVTWVERAYPALDGEHPLFKAVDVIGRRIATVSERPAMLFRVLNDDEFQNCFSGIGGPLYVTTGLLERLKTKDEVAGILAHQLGHIVARHKVGRLMSDLRTARGAAHTGEVIGHILNVGLAPLRFDFVPVQSSVNVARNAAAERENDMLVLYRGFLYSPFNEPDELDADRRAVHYLQAAGIRPWGLLSVVERLAAPGAGGGQLAVAVTHGHLAARARMLQSHLGGDT